MHSTLGQALREFRPKAGMSQRDLANRVGIDFSYISKVENDRIPPPAADTVVAMCQALGIPQEELLALIGKIPSEAEKAIANSPGGQGFLREVQELNLSDDEWKKIRAALSQLRKASQ